MLKLFNSLSSKVEEFKPINPSSPRSAGQVGMYSCGPTVYDFPHIGNLRSFILSDIVRRVIEANGNEVKLIENITNIDDKIIKKAKEKNLSIDELTKEYTEYFFKDIYKLNIIAPTISPKATEHVSNMIKFISQLIEKGFAYVEKDGSVYFDIS